MKIFGISLVKNEADIIEYSLNENTKWADKIFVYDNGSTDGTWEIVNKVARYNAKVVPFKSEAKPFKDGLRAEVFNAYRHLAQEGDWWCVRCDPDEFYIDNPRELLPKVSRFNHCVTSIHFEYGLTVNDLNKVEFDQPIELILEKLRYYKFKQTSELRFIRHRNRLLWPVSYSYPKHKGLISDIKIRIKHYQYRTPNQIKNRLKTRQIAYRQGYNAFKREDVKCWTEKLLKVENSIYDDGKLRIGYISDPNIRSGIQYNIKKLLHTFKIYP